MERQGLTFAYKLNVLKKNPEALEKNEIHKTIHI